MTVQMVLMMDLMYKYYADTDLDGFGDPGSNIPRCEPIDGYVLDNTDCDDNINIGTT